MKNNGAGVVKNIIKSPLISNIKIVAVVSNDINLLLFNGNEDLLNTFFIDSFP